MGAVSVEARGWFEPAEAIGAAAATRVVVLAAGDCLDRLEGARKA